MPTEKKKESSKKLQIALYWAASCGGCEIGMLDIDEKILDLTAAADIVFWPVAMDTKYKDIEERGDESIDVCFFNGGIRNSEQEHLAKLLRKKSKILISFGACAVSGGVPGLANMANREEIFKTAYLQNPSTENPEKRVPKTSVKVKEGELTIPEFYDTLLPLHQVVEVDYFIPGCPPPPWLILDAFNAIIEGKLPVKGSVLAPLKAVCDECRFKLSEKKMQTVKRIYELEKMEEKCFLEQSVICMGPATRAGCHGRCMEGNMPCTGCQGILPNALDQGASMISALASILGIETEQSMSDNEVDALIEKIPDVVGTFYKYTLAASLLNRKVMK
ncbi:MAG: oxidoreductase [Euryarchaeota archaeon]|jgi:F420-non-reducing hydrogenase small subunit|nr:oxidoreductase [Euryarchaeota archaeon]